MHPIEPATAPRNVSVVVISSTDIEVSWEELQLIDENGEIIFYEVEFVPLMLFDGQIAANTTRTSLLNITLTALEEYVEYRVRVRAHTIAGAGPYSDPIIRRTLQAGSYYILVGVKMYYFPFSHRSSFSSTR